MQVILLQTIKGLGKKGEVISVSDGHARNFLIPKLLAEDASVKAIRRHKEKKQVLQRQEKKQRKTVGMAARSLDGYTLHLKEKVNENNVLYAAVTKKTVVKALKKEGFTILASQIDLRDPLKTLGTTKVNIKLSDNFEATIQLKIESNT